MCMTSGSFLVLVFMSSNKSEDMTKFMKINKGPEFSCQKMNQFLFLELEF